MRDTLAHGPDPFSKATIESVMSCTNTGSCGSLSLMITVAARGSDHHPLPAGLTVLGHADPRCSAEAPTLGCRYSSAMKAAVHTSYLPLKNDG
jgi:hypothetical protein